MSTVTLSPKGYAAPSVAGAGKVGFWSRVYAAIVAAQTAKAERELALYLHRTGSDPLK